MIIFLLPFSFLFHMQKRAVPCISKVQQFMEIFNKDTLDDSTAANSSRSCITRATVEQLKSQAAAVQLKQHNQQQQQEIKQKVMIL
jgi:hypothetical protein